MKIIDIALDYIFPPKCGICKKLGEGYICKNCYHRIVEYLYNNVYNKKIFYLLKYEDIIRSKMIDYKFNNQSFLHNMFSVIFIKNKNACEFLKNYDIIIPVPIHRKRKIERGYNQSELIARDLAVYFKIPICTNILIKQKNTVMQSGLGRKDRIKNVQNVYKVKHKEKIKGKNILILDDIYTTGSTIKECKKILKTGGARKVGTIIIAKD